MRECFYLALFAVTYFVALKVEIGMDMSEEMFQQYSHIHYFIMFGINLWYLSIYLWIRYTFAALNSLQRYNYYPNNQPKIVDNKKSTVFSLVKDYPFRCAR